MSITFTPVLANLMGPQGLLILFVLLLLFGARKLPELAKGLGSFLAPNSNNTTARMATISGHPRNANMIPFIIFLSTPATAPTFA